MGSVFAPQFSYVWAKLAYIAAVGAVSGGITTGSWNGAAKGAFTSVLTAGVGGAGMAPVQQAMANAFVGGAVSVMQGGKFGHGFVSAGLGALAGPAINSSVSSPAGQIVAHALVGGSISAVTGGKFANGAATAAFRATLVTAASPGEVASPSAADMTDAKLARGAYDPEFAGAEGYGVIQRFSNARGLRATLFGNGTDFVLAYAGTDPSSWEKWKSKLSKAFGLKSAQYETGLNLAVDIKANYGDVRFTFHSKDRKFSYICFSGWSARFLGLCWPTWNGRRLQGYGVLNMKSITLRVLIVVTTLGVVPIGCSAQVGRLSQMESSERAAHSRAMQHLLAYMPIEKMFPDPAVRSLAKAVGQGDSRMIDASVANGIDINQRGYGNATVLFWAVRMSNLRGFTRLLELGADPNVVFDDGGTVIHWAVRNESPEFLKVVLTHGGDPNLTAGQLDQTPIFEAVGERGDRLEILLDAGADPNIQNAFGSTPVLLAAGRGRFDLVMTLLNRGADYTISNKRGYSLADMVAEKRGMMDRNHELYKWLERVVRWLEDRGVQIPRRDAAG